MSLAKKTRKQGFVFVHLQLYNYILLTNKQNMIPKNISLAERWQERIKDLSLIPLMEVVNTPPSPIATPFNNFCPKTLSIQARNKKVSKGFIRPIAQRTSCADEEIPIPKIIGGQISV